MTKDGSNSVALTFETDNVEGFIGAVAAPPPELASLMERPRCHSPLTVYVEK